MKRWIDTTFADFNGPGWYLFDNVHVDQKTSLIDMTDHYLYKVNVPGFSAEDLEVTIEDKILSINCKSSNEINPEVKFPKKIQVKIDYSDIKVICKNGILYIKFYKKPIEQQKIKISTE